jgi:hypothetical protein
MFGVLISTVRSAIIKTVFCASYKLAKTIPYLENFDFSTRLNNRTHTVIPPVIEKQCEKVVRAILQFFVLLRHSDGKINLDISN